MSAPYKPGDEFKEQNTEVAAFARKHGFRLVKHPDYSKDYPEKILACPKTAGGRGYWFWHGPGKWTFYHPTRARPYQDEKTIMVLAPSGYPASTDEEIYLIGVPAAEALKVMQEGPAWARPMLRARRAYTPEQMEAARERGRALAASQKRG